MRASRHLAEIGDASALDWAHAFRAAVEAISDLGGAKAGDRTMLDALFPAVSAYEEALTSGSPAHRAWEVAVSAAQQGAQNTAQMTPKAGRASYLGTRAVGSPDAGAVAVSLWLAALLPHIGAGQRTTD
jgi:dihydroxyacetone kinase